MTKLSILARVLLGLIYFVFGLNGFFQFLPIKPPPMSDAAMEYFKGMAGTGYFLPLLSGTQTLCGLLLLTGMAAPLGLIILAPITLQIFLFHIRFTPELKFLALPIVMGLAHIVAASAYWPLYRPLFSKGSRNSK